MRKGILGLTAFAILTGTGYAFQDSDLDGVDDSVDQCPGTPILELVDSKGCPISKKKKKKEWRAYLRIGGGFLQDRNEERTYTTLSLALSYKGIYTSFNTRYYTSSKLYSNGMGDSSLFFGYSRFITESIYIFPGIRFKIPTGADQYTNGKVDVTPSVVVDYIWKRYDVFLYISRTFRGDSTLKDTNSASVGGGYDFGKLYLSASYDLSESAVRDAYNSYASLFAIYDINRRLYTTLSYSRGLNDRATDNSASIKIGIRF